jgi:hypothetical protein
MSATTVCMARVALAAALASAGTYAGVALTTPAPAAYTCPTGVNAQQCGYLQDLYSHDLPILPNAVPNIGNFCGQIKSLGAAQAAANLSFAWSGSKYALTLSQAQQYAAIAQSDVCN